MASRKSSDKASCNQIHFCFEILFVCCLLRKFMAFLKIIALVGSDKYTTLNQGLEIENTI